MKTKNIYAIRRRLEQWNEAARKGYEEYDKKLREKYGDHCYNNMVSSTEKENWIKIKSNFQDSQDALDDFDSHEWKSARAPILNTADVYPCKNCDVGWASISTEGCRGCEETCERLKEYEENN